MGTQHNTRNMVKVLFLDIDGVIQVSTPGQISQHHLTYIKNIVDETGCSIVLSSDWRRSQIGRDAVRESLQQQQLDFIDYTPLSRSMYVAERPAEIVAWLRKYNTNAQTTGTEGVTHFVAIDDRDFFNETGGGHMQGHFCKTLIRTGMTPERVRYAVDCLNTPLKPHELADLGTTTNGQSARTTTYSQYSAPSTPTRCTAYNTVTTPTRNNNVYQSTNTQMTSASASRQQIGKPSFDFAGASRQQIGKTSFDFAASAKSTYSTSTAYPATYSTSARRIF